ncbi:MAG: hypothetical protein MUO50_10470 [Longimicrobiales bacterium]|nr:hypothetical protein [Longimicrobiales bacterium]
MKAPPSLMPIRERRISSAPVDAMALFLLFLSGCSYLEPVAEPVAPSVFDVGLAHMAAGDFADAETAFRDAASHCESGSDGRRALLFLSFLALDPRNPAAHPDSAALMAARFLNLPGNTRQETLEAEALYITALDYGADPELRVDPVTPGFAVRFGDCDQPFPPRDQRPLPVLESPTSSRLRSLDEERGALTQENQQLRSTLRRVRLVSDSLQAQVDTLEAELERIRQLIRLPDTVRARRPDTLSVRRPDTTSVRVPFLP